MGADIFSGDLQHIRLSSLLQLVELEHLEGRLHLMPGGELTVHDGQLVSAQYLKYTGVDALLVMLTLTEGRFAFSVQSVEAGQPLCSLMSLLMGSARLEDEWERLAPMILAPVEQVTESLPSLEPIGTLLDGQRTLAEAMVGHHPYTLLDAVIDALEAGQLSEVAPPNPERAALAMKPPSPEEFYPLIDQARQQRKAGNLNGAEESLRRALMLRPEDRVLKQNLRRLRQLRDRRND